MSSGEDDDLVVVEEPEIIQLVEQNNQNEDNNENPEANDANQEIGENQEGEQADKQEVKIKRVRNPQPKLDAERLKGPRGLTMLKDVFEKVKFKGRGYEEEDLSVLMKNYEYWCHRLYPKFPFDDCLERMERLGSKKPVQTHLKKIRMDLLDEEEQTAQPNLDKSDTEENIEDTERSAFDELLPQTSRSTSSVAGITDDQLERIRINRERAQRLRQQMLIRNKEKAKMDFLNNSTDLNKRASNADETEAPTALSQSSNLSDVLNQVDFTETMSTNSEVPTSRLEAMSVRSQSLVENMSVGSESFFSEMSVVSDLPSTAHQVIRPASTENMSISCSQASFAERIVSSQMSTSQTSFNLEGSSQISNATETNESQSANTDETVETITSDNSQSQQTCETIESSNSESQQTIESQYFLDNSASKVHETIASENCIGETINPDDLKFMQEPYSEVSTSRLEAMSVGSQSLVENMSVGSEPFFSEMSVVSDLPSPAHEVIRSASTENMSIGCSQASFAERKVSSQMSTSQMSFNLEGSSQISNATETNESQGANEIGESLESDACGTIESSHSESQQTIESQDFPDNSASTVHEIGETINPEDFLMEVDNSQM